MDLSENSLLKDNLEKIRKNRSSRLHKQEIEERRQHAALVIQRNYRGYTTRNKFHTEIL